MLGQQDSQFYQRRAQGDGYQTNLHNTAETQFSHDTTAVPSLHQSMSDDESPRRSPNDGTWGERDVGGPISREGAMSEFEEMRRQLTNLSLERTRSRASTAAGKSRMSFMRTRTQPTRPITRSTRRASDATGATADDDKEAEPEGTDEDEFDLGGFLRDGVLEKRVDGESAKKVGVVYKNLTVKGVGATVAFTKTLPEAVMGTFGPDLYNLICRFVPSLRLGKKPPTRDLIHDFSGVVRDGEMMLVLGRPGSGCSTFLKAIANERGTYAAVEGDVHYGGISAAEQKKYYKGEVNYNPEDDTHFPDLNVEQTLKFALANKTRKNEQGSIPVIVAALLSMFGITHTKYTKVGNEYVRGVSGGERKRVGIAETLATKSTVVCWDNSTRGLDASTALDYAKSLRVMTDISNRTTLVTLYQAGEGIYELMDKVLVVEGGRMIYQGPANIARQYFVDLGYHAPDRQTTADFLTSVGDPNERQFRSDVEPASIPKTAEELEAAFRKSDIWKNTLADVEDYERNLHNNQCAETRQFQQAVKDQQSNSPLDKSLKRSSYTVSFWRQVMACTKREFWLFWGDRSSLYTKAFIIIANGLIVGSLFYGESFGTSGAFSRGGALFFSILFLGWLQLSELIKAVSGRVVIARHREYAFYRPSAVVIARVLLDIPVVAVQSVIFSVILYWMANLDADPGKFFIYLLFVYTSTICITALYRMFAALSPTIDDAVRFSGIALNLLIIYVGYVIPKQTLTSDVIWFGWLFYVNPVAYSYEAVLTNEFAGRIMDCDPTQLVPQGPGVQEGFQGCALTGAEPNSVTVSGTSYFSTSFSYSRSNLWRNFGVVIAFTVLYLLVTAIASELFSFAQGGGGALIFKKTKKSKQIAETENKAVDEESTAAPQASNSDSSETLDGEKNEVPQDITGSKSVFTFEDVTYEVPYQGGTRKLLNNVNGYVEPGMMIALMGASGAGKTTLLNTLSQRQKMGTVGGNMLVDGQPLGADFARGTGFCEQMDLHDMTATVREALEFSALLRQDRHVPRQEKLDYVNKVIELLELQQIEDAIIMSLGVEQRKRLTIGVELAAKPDLLLFLDEPTSGLDAQSAFSIVRFLKKLTQAGQAIICTIHQPSSMLIQQFDMILALNPGGNCFYFGPVGDNGSAVTKYFADRGTQCPPNKNVAEFILETAAKGGKRGKDGKRVNWNQTWLESDNNAEVLKKIKQLKESRSKEVGEHPRNEKEVYAYAAPVWEQTYLLTKRTFVQYWRDPSYLYGKLFVSVIIGIFNGFTFYDLGNSIASLQSRLFTPFLILLIPPTIVNGVLPKFYMSRALWEAREGPSRIYGWFAFCTAQVVAEIPMAILGSVVYFLLWYYPTGLPRDSSTAGYVFFMTMLWFLFQASWVSLLLRSVSENIADVRIAGSMDLCLCAQFHGHFERSAILLRR
jgi:ATP-binding cassette, subfamily G (WHITE), member 2, SNQ2